MTARTQGIIQSMRNNRTAASSWHGLTRDTRRLAATTTVTVASTPLTLEAVE